MALALLVCGAMAGTSAGAEDVPGAAEFHNNIQPILQNYCYDCHGDGASKGKVTFDQFKSDQDVLTNRDLWWKALKNVRAGIMPPAEKAASDGAGTGANGSLDQNGCFWERSARS